MIGIRKYYNKPVSLRTLLGCKQTKVTIYDSLLKFLLRLIGVLLMDR